MGIIGGEIGYQLLRFMVPRKKETTQKKVIGEGNSKLKKFFSDKIEDIVKDKVVIDFGCGMGFQSIEMAEMGAKKVVGLDIQESFLEQGRERAKQAGFSDRCVFVSETDEKADVIISVDAFEHFADPIAILNAMSRLLKPNGYILISFGPTWFHPKGGHLFSFFPWSHLIFSEKALLRWRSDFKTDGAKKFSDVDGGLNQMTLKNFKKIVEGSPFEFVWLDTVSIWNIELLKVRAFREFSSSLIRCKIILKK